MTEEHFSDSSSLRDSSSIRELIRSTLYSYLSTVEPADLIHLTPSNVRCNVLETQLNLDLTEYKDFIKGILMKHVEENEVAINESKEDEEDEENGDYSNDEVAAKKTAGKGWSAPVQLSSTLAAFIGQESCARTEVTKLVWKYIKANNLQDSADKRYINCDDALQTVLNTKRIHMFSMTKELSKHMKSVVDLNDGEGAKAKVKKAVSSVKKRKSENSDNTDGKRRGGGGGGGFAKLMRPSDELRQFFGLDIHEGIGRTTCVKSLWDYIKANGLQNPNDKREILLDARLQHVFGVKTFSMFSMNKYLTNHLTDL